MPPFLKIRRDWSPWKARKIEFGKFGAFHSERLEPSIRRDWSTPYSGVFLSRLCVGTTIFLFPPKMIFDLGDHITEKVQSIDLDLLPHAQSIMRSNN